jgi:hypothetical protein
MGFKDIMYIVNIIVMGVMLISLVWGLWQLKLINDEDIRDRKEKLLKEKA